MTQMLLTQALRRRFTQIGSQEESDDPIVIAHYFTGSWDWYATEFDKRTGYSPVVWGAWKMNWTGYEHVDNKSNKE